MTKYSFFANKPANTIIFDDNVKMITVQCKDAKDANSIADSVSNYLRNIENSGESVPEIKAHQPESQTFVDLTGNIPAINSFLINHKLISSVIFLQLVIAAMEIPAPPEPIETLVAKTKTFKI